MESNTFAPYLKHYGKTKEEQIEKNKPAMAWLKKQMEEEISEEDRIANHEHWLKFIETVDSYRPEGFKLYSKYTKKE